MKGIFWAGFARIVLPAALVLGGCNKDEETSDFSNIISVNGILDVGNALNGSDLMIDLDISDNSLTEFWVIVNKAENFLNVSEIQFSGTESERNARSVIWLSKTQL